MSKFKKCAWNWAYYNLAVQERLSKIPTESWTAVNTSGASVEDYQSVFEFIGLKGFSSKWVEKLITGRINSIQDRLGIADDFPSWRDWDEEHTKRFDEIAGFMMRKLGYYK